MKEEDKKNNDPEGNINHNRLPRIDTNQELNAEITDGIISKAEAEDVNNHQIDVISNSVRQGSGDVTVNRTATTDDSETTNPTTFSNGAAHMNGYESRRNNATDATSIPIDDIYNSERRRNNAINGTISRTSPLSPVSQFVKKKLIWMYRYLCGPVPERQVWKNPTESYLCHVSYCVGLGNLWRFPFYCFKHGGATFLIPYGICLLVIGLPMLFVDISLGQYLSLGPTNMYTKMAPLFSGLGWAMMSLAVLISIYYNMVLAWSLFYLYSSFQKTLPWIHCENLFNTPGCQNNSYLAADQYFKNFVLHLKEDGDEDSSKDGDYDLHSGLILSLALAWVLVMLCLARGIRSYGKVVYITVTLPYIVLLILLAYSYLTFDTGSWENSIHKYFSPTQVNATKLMDGNLWADAATQVLFSLGAVTGVHMTLASYNKLEQNTLSKSCFIIFWDTATSFLCGLVVFTSLSQLAFEMGVKVGDILNGKDTLGGIGVELVFIAYPTLLGRVYSPIWSVLFFLMILALGIDSMIGRVESIATAIFDNFVRLRQRYLPVVCLMCLILFLLGLPLCTRKGIYLVELMHVYTCKVSMLIIGLLKIIVVCYVFGFSKLMRLIREELRVYVPRPVQWYLAITLFFLVPLSCVCLLLWTAVFEGPQQLNGAPLQWGFRTIGWLLAIASCLIVPAVAIGVLYKNRGRDWRELLMPTGDCKPKYLRQEPGERPMFVMRDHDSLTNSIAEHDENTSNKITLHDNTTTTTRARTTTTATRVPITQLHPRQRRLHSF